MWRAPPSGSGCVIFTAMVLENNVRWYAEDGALSKSVCESTSEEVESLNLIRCCACDEAKYSVSRRNSGRRDGYFIAPVARTLPLVSCFFVLSEISRERREKESK